MAEIKNSYLKIAKDNLGVINRENIHINETTHSTNKKNKNNINNITICDVNLHKKNPIDYISNKILKEDEKKTKSLSKNKLSFTKESNMKIKNEKLKKIKNKSKDYKIQRNQNYNNFPFNLSANILNKTKEEIILEIETKFKLILEEKENIITSLKLEIEKHKKIINEYQKKFNINIETNKLTFEKEKKEKNKNEFIYNDIRKNENQNILTNPGVTHKKIKLKVNDNDISSNNKNDNKTPNAGVKQLPLIYNLNTYNNNSMNFGGGNVYNPQNYEINNINKNTAKDIKNSLNSSKKPKNKLLINNISFNKDSILEENDLDESSKPKKEFYKLEELKDRMSKIVKGLISILNNIKI